jgi:hypothetical protein
MHALDVSLVSGILMLGMALGALLTRIRLRATVARIVHEELDRIAKQQAGAEGNKIENNRPDAA